jgi:hypothetical protein
VIENVIGTFLNTLNNFIFLFVGSSNETPKVHRSDRIENWKNYIDEFKFI